LTERRGAVDYCLEHVPLLRVSTREMTIVQTRDAKEKSRNRKRFRPSDVRT